MYAQNTSTMTGSRTPLAQATDLARIETISRQRPAALAWSLGLMAWAVFVLWQQAPASQLLTWWGANAVFALWRFTTWRREAGTEPPAPVHARSWLNASARANLLAGLIWGVGALAFLDHKDTGIFVLFMLVLTALTCGAAISLAAWLPCVVAFCLPVIALVAVKVLLLDLVHGPLIAASCLVYFAFVMTVARNYAHVVSDAIVLRLENEALLAEAERQNETVARVSRERSRFFAAVSHDLRQPLYAMGLLLDSLGKRLEAPAQRKLHTDIKRSHHALDDLFNSLLDVAELDYAHIPVRPTDFRIDELATTVAAEFEPGLTAKGLRLELDVSPVWVHTDRLLLSRIVRNLLSNAVKFTAEGTIFLGVQRTGDDDVALVVRDEGRGIAPEDQARIFDEYFQIGNPERDRTKGLGLGLFVVQRLCDTLSLKLSLHAAAGQGSTFSLRLPAAPDQTSARDGTRAFGGLHVLFIDDEPDIRRGMRLLLEDHDCRVTAGESAAAALAELPADARPVDIVLSDYRLRDETDGIEAIARVRAALDPELPAMLITGDTDPAIGERAVAADLSLLHKPVAPDSLLKAIANRV
jgi:signal transduction histidine kinase